MSDGPRIPTVYSTPQIRFCLLRHASYLLGHDRRVSCNLWRMESSKVGSQDSTYAIGMSLSHCRRIVTQRLCVIGRDLEEAVRLFEILVRGNVSPCTLTDILEDLGCREVED